MARSLNIRRPSIKVVLGCIFLLTAVALTIFIPYPGLAIRLSIYILFGIALVLLITKNDSSVSVNYPNFTFSIVGGIAVPIILILIDPIGRFKVNQQERLVSTTVFVHGKKGKFDMVLRQQGHVIMEVNGTRQKQPISENGDAHFGNLQVGDNVRLEIDFSEPYHPINKDSVYRIDETGKIYLQVALEGLGQIEGMVLYNEMPIAGVIVSTGEFSDTTNDQGYYKIIIPEAQQLQKYDLVFIKNGFKVKKASSLPQTGQSLDMIMEKKL